MYCIAWVAFSISCSWGAYSDIYTSCMHSDIYTSYQLNMCARTAQIHTDKNQGRCGGCFWVIVLYRCRFHSAIHEPSTVISMHQRSYMSVLGLHKYIQIGPRWSGNKKPNRDDGNKCRWKQLIMPVKSFWFNDFQLSHFGDIVWVLRHLNSLATSLFVWQLPWVNTKEKHAYWLIVREIDQWLLDTPHKGPVMQTTYRFNDVIIIVSLSSKMLLYEVPGWLWMWIYYLPNRVALA